MRKTFQEIMNWRFACKHFDINKKIDDKILHELLDLSRLSPSSYGLQAWKFIVITNPELQKKLSKACYEQPQIAEASAIVIFCARTDIDGENGLINRYLKKAGQDLKKSEKELENFASMLKGDLLNRTTEAIKIWTQKQVYLPAMTLALAAAEKEIDSCPIEGFDPKETSKILELPDFLHPTLIVALGYRNMEQPPKTRFNFEDVIEIRY